VGPEVLIDDHQKREVAGVDGRIIGLFSEPSQHPAEAVDSDLHLVEGHLLVSAKDGEDGMMLLTMIWSAFIRFGRIHYLVLPPGR
jgi:hypothetical protein